VVVRSAPAQHTYAATYGPLYAPRRARYTFVLECTCVEGNVSLHLVDEAADRFIDGEEFEIAERGRRLFVASADLDAGQPFTLLVANRHRGGDEISHVTIHALYGSAELSELSARANAASLASAVRRFAFKAVRSLSRRAAALLPRSTATAKADGGPAIASLSAASRASVSAVTTRIEEYCREHRLPPVHRNAAGDFQLMARRHWFELHGYAEFTMYSMNIDGLLDDVAHHAGIREETLGMPCCIYHLEHTQGSGWTPEGEGLLRKRLAESGADWLDAATVDLWSGYMAWLKRPMLFNQADWGFGDDVLAEFTIAAASTHVDA
jgi:hypothetical protein